MCSTLLETCAHAVDLGDKPVEAKTLLEFPVLPGRPHGQRPAHLEGRVCGGDAGVVVEAIIVERREGVGAVVHVQENRIESAGVRA